MEYGLWPIIEPRLSVRLEVLILVLMEYGLWRNSTAFGTKTLAMS